MKGIKTDRRAAEKLARCCRGGSVARPGAGAANKDQHEALEVTLLNCLHEVEHVAQRIVHLEAAIDEAAREALREVTQTIAATIVSELGSLSRVANTRQLMGESGLVASEHCRGGKLSRGPITKTGNAHVRRVLVEASWSYQHQPSLSDEVKAID